MSAITKVATAQQVENEVRALCFVQIYYSRQQFPRSVEHAAQYFSPKHVTGQLKSLYSYPVLAELELGIIAHIMLVGTCPLMLR
jgi:hypothetical protein